MSPSEIQQAVEVCRAAGYDPATCGRTILSKVCGIKEYKAREVQATLRQSSNVVENVVPSIVEAKPKATFDSALAAYREWLGMSENVVTTAPETSLGTTQRIVIAGDLHVPFHHKEAVNALIREEAAQTDLLIINGDIGDFWATSRWPKSKRLVSPREELLETQAVLALLAENFKKVVILGGNHDARPQKFLVALLPPDVLDYISLTGPMVFRPLEFMAAGLSNVEVVTPITTEHAEFAFIYQHGDLLCTHAERYSTIPGKTATTVLQWVKSFAEPQNVVGKVRCLVQGHSHLAATVHADYGCLAIDGGCLSQLQDYHSTPKIYTPRPLAQGWTVVYQTDGRTDFRTSRFVPFHG